MTLADTLKQGPFELILSSGFFGFYAHAGVVSALEEAGLKPALVGGSSAGALVGGLWGAGIGAEAIRERLFALRREHFWDPDPRLGLGLRGVGAGPGLLKGRRFEAILTESLGAIGVRSFGDCATPVRVVVWDVALRRAVTLHEGELAPAIRASCTVPGMFQPVIINDRRYLDGGITDRPGIGAASPGARVLYHHLPAHSPWRRFIRSQNHPPERADLHVLLEPSLPRMSPFHLDRGPRAFELARAMTWRELDRPI